ncbi:MAG: hypothetical protein J5J06_02730 [Phycisphaerae bacterium]|nr:hypothetical protein [Phycisphaerae bacterium]
MRYMPPKQIELTQSETDLYARIPDMPSSDNWQAGADAMEELVTSLLDRNAVPEVRLRLFQDTDYTETDSGKSPETVFESNGKIGSAIYRDGNFIPYLRHWIEGPNLPSHVVDGLCAIMNEDRGTSGMMMKQYQSFAREAVRKYNLNAQRAAKEFFRLGVEIGMEIGDARVLRQAAMSAR